MRLVLLSDRARPGRPQVGQGQAKSYILALIGSGQALLLYNVQIKKPPRAQTIQMHHLGLLLSWPRNNTPRAQITCLVSFGSIVIVPTLTVMYIVNRIYRTLVRFKKNENTHTHTHFGPKWHVGLLLSSLPFLSHILLSEHLIVFKKKLLPAVTIQYNRFFNQIFDRFFMWKGTTFDFLWTISHMRSKSNHC